MILFKQILKKKSLNKTFIKKKKINTANDESMIS